jgi:hypothetical protein
MVRKVRYIVGSGCELGVPLSTGQRVFEAGIVYDVSNYADFHRLIKHGDFEEVLDEIPAEEVLEVAPEVPSDEPVEEPQIIKISPNKKKGVSE